MSVPKTVFIDTCIFDELAYNFRSEKVRAFVAAAKRDDVVLLLPQPIEREICRHIETMADGVVTALEEAKRKAPFLAKWKEWPKRKSGFWLERELYEMAMREWNAFLGSLNVVKLGYAGIDLREIMDWYENHEPPFGEGKRRKEFPDAIAYATVLAYAKKGGHNVAVVSKDAGFRDACRQATQMVHFETLPAYTEALVASDERVKLVNATLSQDVKLLEEQIAEVFPDLTFYPDADPEGNVEDVEAIGVEITDIKILAVGDKQCSVAFDCAVEFSAYVKYDDPDTAITVSSEDFYMALHKKAGEVSDFSEISGTAKLTFEEGWKRLAKVDRLEIDDADVVVCAEPKGFEGEDDY